MRQSVQTQMHEVHTESIDIPGTQLPVSRVPLGIWAMGAVGGLAVRMPAMVHCKNPSRLSAPTCSP
jgi:hypothetical protein